MWLHREGIIRRRPSGARFIDTETGEELTEAEAVLRNQHHLPPEMMPIPGRLREFLQDTPTQLVEVGRLKDINVPMRSEYEARRTPNRVSAISHRSTQLAEMIKAVRALYSVAAQRVDRSYASRLIGASLSSPTPSDAAIRDVYADLLKRQDDLAALSLLETQDEFLELPPGELAPWQRRAVGIHLSDSLKKLATFDSMASKMGLFESIVNSKLEHKVMGFDADNGLAFTSAIGDGAPIAPDQLSSGEQHLIVVTFRLLFEAEPGELVLVDEPEISLHVAWQRQFLDDLQRIAGLRELRFIVATHSPQIVGRWTSRLVQIGSVE
jgi:ABC-type ATPase involved in cell division